jgi:hypothetical protein
MESVNKEITGDNRKDCNSRVAAAAPVVVVVVVVVVVL